MHISGDADAANLRGVEMIERRPHRDSLRRLHDDIRQLLDANRAALLYHGWPHARFVTKHAMELAQSHGVDEAIIGSAALVHDLNYLIRPNSEPTVGAGLIADRMRVAGYPPSQVTKVIQIVDEANLATRGPKISIEAACLSDADTLFKALPFTPLLLAPAYLAENRVSLRDLAMQIVTEQEGRLKDGYYFYFSEVKERYTDWARENIAMWRRISDALADEELCWLSEQLYNLHKGLWNVQ